MSVAILGRPNEKSGPVTLKSIVGTLTWGLSLDRGSLIYKLSSPGQCGLSRHPPVNYLHSGLHSKVLSQLKDANTKPPEGCS